MQTAHNGQSEHPGLRPTEWCRTVFQPLGRPGFHMQTTERLDLNLAAERLMEAIRERPDAGVVNWLDHALHGALGDLTPNEEA